MGLGRQRPFSIKWFRAPYAETGITIKGYNTHATGILGGFRHDTEALNDSYVTSDHWINGDTTTTITLLLDQGIVAKMGDQMLVQG